MNDHGSKIIPLRYNLIVDTVWDAAREVLAVGVLRAVAIVLGHGDRG